MTDTEKRLLGTLALSHTVNLIHSGCTIRIGAEHVHPRVGVGYVVRFVGTDGWVTSFAATAADLAEVLFPTSPVRFAFVSGQWFVPVAALYAPVQVAPPARGEIVVAPL